MAKRRRSLEDEVQSPTKKIRLQLNNNFSTISDEVLLKILTHLSIYDLGVVPRVSQRWRRLAGDSELWKEKYYGRWVRPRALRIPGLRDGASSSTLRYSSKLAKWLDHGHLVHEDKKTDWKTQYRLRYNWWRGSCRLSVVEVAQTPVPSVLVKMNQGVIYTVDAGYGLRAWSVKSKESLLARHTFTRFHPAPTSLGVDTAVDSSDRVKLCIGFEDGSFSMYQFTTSASEIQTLHSHPGSSNGAISAVALTFPHILTMSHNKTLSLYHFKAREHGSPCPTLASPRLLASLRSSIVYAPLSLSIRSASSGIVASVAYAFSCLNHGWSIGLQELRLTGEGEARESRLASTLEIGVMESHPHKSDDLKVAARSVASPPFVLHPQSMAQPSSLSYSHPYLLASLPDNTLMIYLVVSDAKRLEITTGRRLWGHTSAVSGVEVSDRGKAVSVSTKGNEIRVWELEDVISSTSHRKSSVQLAPQKQDLRIVAEAIGRRGTGLGLAVQNMQRELALTRSWVGFDDEQVVVLGEHWKRQILSCYDFS